MKSYKDPQSCWINSLLIGEAMAKKAPVKINAILLQNPHSMRDFKQLQWCCGVTTSEGKKGRSSSFALFPPLIVILIRIIAFLHRMMHVHTQSLIQWEACQDPKLWVKSKSS